MTINGFIISNIQYPIFNFKYPIRNLNPVILSEMSINSASWASFFFFSTETIFFNSAKKSKKSG